VPAPGARRVLTRRRPPYALCFLRPSALHGWGRQAPPDGPVRSRARTDGPLRLPAPPAPRAHARECFAPDQARSFFTRNASQKGPRHPGATPSARPKRCVPGAGMRRAPFKNPKGSGGSVPAPGTRRVLTRRRPPYALCFLRPSALRGWGRQAPPDGPVRSRARTDGPLRLPAPPAPRAHARECFAPDQARSFFTRNASHKGPRHPGATPSARPKRCVPGAGMRRVPFKNPKGSGGSVPAPGTRRVLTRRPGDPETPRPRDPETHGLADPRPGKATSAAAAGR
jgi:hypothetical protein